MPAGTFDKLTTMDCTNSAEWETWLESHHERASDVWLRIAKKGSGKTSITIPEALDVALCYGWIDSQRKAYDETYYLQRYSPRRPKSPWSKINAVRAQALIASGAMRAAGLREIEAARKDGRWDAAYESQRNVNTPPDLETALAKNPQAKNAFDQFDKTAQYAVILPILKAVTPGRRAIVLQKTIAKLEAGSRAEH